MKSLDSRLSSLEATTGGRGSSNPLVQVRQLMEFAFGPNWVERLDELTADHRRGQDYCPCWACCVLRWCGHRPDRQGYNPADSARSWLATLDRIELTDRPIPMMAPFWGMSMAREWRKLQGLTSNAEG